MAPQTISLVRQQHALEVVALLEANNVGGLTREEIGRFLEGSAPSDPQERALYDERVRRQGEEEFDEDRKVSRAMFEAGIEGWAFIWHRHAQGDIRWHVMAKVENGFRTPIVGFYAASQIAHSESKEYKTRTRSTTRIEVSHLKAMESHANQLPKGPERQRLLKEVEARFNAVEIRCLRLAALNLDSGMRFEDFEQLANPRDKRLRIFSKQTKAYVEAQKKANKELQELMEMYEVFKLILGKDTKELGEGAGKMDRARP